MCLTTRDSVCSLESSLSLAKLSLSLTSQSLWCVHTTSMEGGKWSCGHVYTTNFVQCRLCWIKATGVSTSLVPLHTWLLASALHVHTTSAYVNAQCGAQWVSSPMCNMQSSTYCLWKVLAMHGGSETSHAGVTESKGSTFQRTTISIPACHLHAIIFTLLKKNLMNMHDPLRCSSSLMETWSLHSSTLLL